MIEINRYKIMIKGIANNCHHAKSIPQVIKKMNFTPLPCHPNDLNFRANKGNSATNKYENSKQLNKITSGCKRKYKTVSTKLLAG